MKPENEWFRPPHFMELARIGDFRHFVWVAEPEHPKERKGRPGIFGVYYRVSELFLFDMQDIENLLDVLKGYALAELRRRIRRGTACALYEGVVYEKMTWTPIFVRHEDGTVEISGLRDSREPLEQLELPFDEVESRSGA